MIKSRSFGTSGTKSKRSQIIMPWWNWKSKQVGDWPGTRDSVSPSWCLLCLAQSPVNYQLSEPTRWPYHETWQTISFHPLLFFGSLCSACRCGFASWSAWPSGERNVALLEITCLTPHTNISFYFSFLSLNAMNPKSAPLSLCFLFTLITLPLSVASTTMRQLDSTQQICPSFPLLYNHIDRSFLYLWSVRLWDSWMRLNLPNESSLLM